MKEVLSFDQIVLKKEEYSLLERLTVSFLPDYRENAHAEMLVRHGFAKKTMVAAPGQEYLYALVIENRGIDYIAYIRRAKRIDRKARRHDWYIAIVSICIGALLSEPLWMFLRWLLEKFQSAQP